LALVEDRDRGAAALRAVLDQGQVPEKTAFQAFDAAI
jgi:hypothetical protein